MKDLQAQINEMYSCCDALVPVEVTVTHQIESRYTVCVPVPVAASESERAAAVSAAISRLDIGPDLTGSVQLVKSNWVFK